MVDQSVTGFIDGATDVRTLAAIGVGSLAYQAARAGFLSLGFRGAVLSTLARPASVAVGLLSEATAFEATERVFDSFSSHPQNSNRWSWSGRGGWAEALPATLISFGTLKSVGFLSRNTNVILQQAMASGSMVAAHQLTAALHLTPRPEGSLLDQWIHAQVMNLQLGFGMQLVHGFAARFRPLPLDFNEELLPSRETRPAPGEFRIPAFAMAIGVESEGNLGWGKAEMSGEIRGGGSVETDLRPLESPRPNPFRDFLERTLSFINERKGKRVLSPQHQHAFRSLVESALRHRLPQEEFEERAIEILRQDYFEKLHFQGGEVKRVTLSSLQASLQKRGRQLPEWLRDWVSEDPSLLEQGGYQLVLSREGTTPRQAMMESFHFISGSMAHYETTLGFGANELYELRPHGSYVILFEDVLFMRMMRRRYSQSFMGFRLTTEVSPLREAIQEINAADEWPLVLSPHLVEGVHESKLHPFAEVFHDRYLHWGMMSSLDPEGRRMLNALSQGTLQADPFHSLVSEATVDAVMSYLFRDAKTDSLRSVLNFYRPVSGNVHKTHPLYPELLRRLEERIREEARRRNPHASYLLEELRSLFGE